MIFKQLFDRETWTYTYILADSDSKEAIIIDPVSGMVERDLKLINELELQLVYTLDTHVHADHITGSGDLRRETGAISGLSEVASVACVDLGLIHGDRLRFGKYELEVRSTPGHTDGCLTYVVEDGDKTMAFTGDALFVRGCGRTDFQQGDASTLYRSVHQQLFTLPSNTVVYPGHDYRGHTATTISEEKAFNPRLNQDVTEESFVKIMSALKLSDPKFMDVAIPANLACGHDFRETPPSSPTFSEIQPAQLNDLEQHVIIDVRNEDEFYGQLGHIPGAVLAPLGHLIKRATDWDINTPVLMVCRSGSRSRQACALLENLGFSDVSNLLGGMVAYNAEKERCVNG